MPSSRLAVVAIVLGLVGTVPTAPAKAHAIIVDSSPAVDASAKGPDVPITLRFNSRIDRERSRLSLVDAKGNSSALPLAKSGPPDILTATAKGLAAGDYKLRWQVLAIDGHITRGDIPFHVAAP
ncbi:MAG: copper resistance protein CopC [Rhodospirillales bacterium]|jgi:methionine-rich copper-binding protein CopC|nr:copper resistance protein CopC [Rhodospirillales bacterium]